MIFANATKTEVTVVTSKGSYLPGEEVSVTLGFKDLAKSSTAGLFGFTVALQYNSNIFDISPYSSFSAPDNTNVYNAGGYTKGTALSNASNYDFSAPVDIDRGGGIHELRFLVLDNTSGSSPTPYADFDIATVKFQVKMGAPLGSTTFSYRSAYTSMLDSGTFDMVDTSKVQENTASVIVSAANTANYISSFSFPASLSTIIDNTAGTIAVKVPFGTSVTSLVSKFVSSPFSTVKVGATAQVSETTSNNFTGAVTYIVTSESGVTKNYVVTVTIDVNRAALNSGITTATGAASAAVIGTAVGNYSQENLGNLNTAINNARSVAVNSTVIQSAVDFAVTDLSNAVLIFQSTAVPVGTKIVLASTITNALVLWANTPTGGGIGQATLANKNTLKGAIDAAIVVRDNGGATQPQIDTAVATLDTAVTTFKGTFTSGPSKIALLTKINSANIMKSNAIVGKANGQYAQSAISNLQTAITSAQTTYNDVAATQTAVNNATATLDTAMVTFLASVATVTDVPLNTAIIDAQNFISTAIIGTSYGTYLQATVDTLTTAIQTAITTYNNGLASQPTIDGATTSLRAAINTALGLVIPTTGNAGLGSAIANAQNIVANATIGIIPGNYLQASKDTLNAAIVSAQSVYSNGSSTQPQINAAIVTLNTVVLNFKVIAPTLANKTALNTAITEARTVYNAAVVGSSASGQFTQAKKDSLALAYSSAQSVLADASVLQGVVDTTVTTLNNAVLILQNSALRASITSVSVIINHTDGKLSNISPDTTLSIIQSAILPTLDGTISVYKPDGTTLISTGTTKIGTGAVIKLTDSVGTKTYKVFVYGDINGDGVINLVDLLLLRRHLLSTSLLTGLPLEAADAKRTGAAISPSDMVYIKGYILGTRVITQN